LNMGMHGVSRIGCCCSADCECEPVTLGAFTTNSVTPVWDLSPYRGPQTACPGARWQLREVGATGAGGTLYGFGVVDENGYLTGLPSSFQTSYIYDGYMRLEIGCVDETTGNVIWPPTLIGNIS